MKSSIPKKKFASTIESLPSSRPSSARIKKYSQELLEHPSLQHLSLARRHSDEQEMFGSSSYSSDPSRMKKPHNRSPKPRPRKFAQVQRYSDFEVVDDVLSIEQVMSPKQRQRPEVGSSPTLYTIFQKILEVQQSVS